MIKVLGDESEPVSKTNSVQSTPVPIQLLEVLFTLIGFISDHC